MRSNFKALILAAVSGSAATVADGAVLNWLNPAGGSYLTGANWSPNQVPTAVDDLTFGIAGTYTVSLPTVASTSRTETYRLGTVTLQSSNLSTHFVTDQLKVARFSTDVATLRISSPVQVASFVTVGQDAGSNGTLSVGAADRLSVTGVGADLIIGQAGTGAGLIGGGEVNLADDLILGNLAGSAGMLTVQSAVIPFPPSFHLGSVSGAATVGSDALIGNQGAGEVQVMAGGALGFPLNRVALGEATGSTGVLTVDGGTVNAGTLHVAHNLVAAGAGGATVTVRNGGQISVTNDVQLGDLGGQSSATIIDLQAGGTLRCGSLQNVNGSVRFNGGDLIVSGGAWRSTNGNAALLSGLSGASRVSLINGASASFSAPAGSTAMTLPSAGTLNLDCTSGSTLTVPSGRLIVGNQAGSVGAIRVAGALLSASEELDVGGSGAGTLTLEAGGEAHVGTLRVGTSAGSNGVVHVDAPGALLEANGNAMVGAIAFPGLLTISNGGVVRAHGSFLALGTGVVEVGIGGLLQSDLGVSCSTLHLAGGTVTTPECRVLGTSELEGTINGRFLVMADPARATLTGDLIVNAGGLDLPLRNLGGVINLGAHTLDIRDAASPDGGWLGNVTMTSGGRIVSDSLLELLEGKVLSGSGEIAAPIFISGTVDCQGSTNFMHFTKPVFMEPPGQIVGNRVFFLSGSSFSGSGRIAARVYGDTFSSVTATGTLDMGLSGEHGVDLNGPLHVGTASVIFRGASLAAFRAATMLGGSITAESGILLQGRLSGHGTIITPRVSSEASYCEIATEDLIAISGNYDQTRGQPGTIGGVLEVTLDAPTGHGRLVVGGVATLGGALRVLPVPGFDPHDSEGFTVLSASSVVGTFNSLELPPGYTVTYTPTSVIVNAPCAADFNRDGGVDGDDVIGFFGAWDNSEPAGDFNGDGGVDGDDVIGFFANWDAGC